MPITQPQPAHLDPAWRHINTVAVPGTRVDRELTHVVEDRTRHIYVPTGQTVLHPIIRSQVVDVPYKTVTRDEYTVHTQAREEAKEQWTHQDALNEARLRPTSVPPSNGPGTPFAQETLVRDMYRGSMAKTPQFNSTLSSSSATPTNDVNQPNSKYPLAQFNPAVMTRYAASQQEQFPKPVCIPTEQLPPPPFQPYSFSNLRCSVPPQPHEQPQTAPVIDEVRGSDFYTHFDDLGLSICNIVEAPRFAVVHPLDRGVIIASVHPNSYAEQAGFQVGDQVHVVHNRDITNIDDFASAVRRTPGDLLFKVHRDQSEMVLEIKYQPKRMMSK